MGWCECSKLKAMQISSWNQLPNGHLSHTFCHLKGTKCTEGFQESLLRLSSRSCFGLPQLIRSHHQQLLHQQCKISASQFPGDTWEHQEEAGAIAPLCPSDTNLSLCAVSWASAQMAKEAWATHTFPWAWRDVTWLRLIKCNIEFGLPGALTPHLEVSSPLQCETVKAILLHF